MMPKYPRELFGFVRRSSVLVGCGISWVTKSGRSGKQKLFFPKTASVAFGSVYKLPEGEEMLCCV